MSPHFEAMEANFQTLLGLREKPTGTIRITAADFSFHTLLWPVLETFLARYPDISVEVNCDYRLVDIVADRYDAGVRYDDTVGEGMIATRIAPDMRMAVVATPDYFAVHVPPGEPRELGSHNCINMRFPPMAASILGSSKKKVSPRMSRSVGNSLSMVSIRHLTPVGAGQGWGICRKHLFSSTSTVAT